MHPRPSHPSFFVSHGAPTLPLTDVPARHFLEGLGVSIDANYGRPRAILIASAHWETATPQLNAPQINPTIHDFSGFPEALYNMTYSAPGSRPLADQAGALLDKAGLGHRIDPNRGLDHGAWVPLRLMYPQADIPVVQLSIQPDLGPEHHLRLGQALAPLRADGVLVIGSGSYSHDLSEFRNHRNEPPSAAEPIWLSGFSNWFSAALTEGRTADLLAYRSKAPYAAKNHPTDEHLLPIYVAMGAAGAEPMAKHLHQSNTFGILRMDVWQFESLAETQPVAA